MPHSNRLTRMLWFALFAILVFGALPVFLRISSPPEVFNRYSIEYLTGITAYLLITAGVGVLAVRAPSWLMAGVGKASDWLHRVHLWWLPPLVIFMLMDWRLHWLVYDFLPRYFSPATAANLMAITVLLLAGWLAFAAVLPGWKSIPDQAKGGQQADNPLLVYGLVLLAAGMFIYQVVRFFPFVVDDAFITFRYSANLAAGHGITYNPGQPPVEGYTTFLWMIIMAIPHLLGLDAVAASKVLGLVFTAGMLASGWFLTGMLGKSISPAGRRTAKLFALAFLCALPGTAIHAVSGMETALFTFLVTLFYAVLLHVVSTQSLAAIRTAAMLGLLMGLTRPEGNAIAAIGLAGLLATLPPVQRKQLFISASVLYFLPAIVYYGLRTAYFGLLFPIPFYVKTTGLFLGYPALHDFAFYVLPRFGLMLLVSIRIINRENIGIFAASAFLILFYATPMHIMGYDWRYFFPIVPFMMALSGIGLAKIIDSLQRAMAERSVGFRRMLTGATVVIPSTMLCVIMLTLDSGSSAGWTEHYMRGLTRAHMKIAGYLSTYKPIAGEDMPRLAIGDAGIIPYYSAWTTLDTWGLNTPEIAMADEYPTDLLVEFRPDLMIIVSTSAHELQPRWAWSNHVFDASRALNLEKTHAVRAWPGYYLWLMVNPQSPVAEFIRQWEP